MEEQRIVSEDGCPNCGCKEIKYYQRTKGEITYMVYVCKMCKMVIRREMS